MPENQDDLAERLRAAVSQEVDNLPATTGTDFVDRIETRVRRRRRQRQALVAALGVVVTAVMIAGVLLTIPGDESSLRTAGRDDDPTTTTTTKPTTSTTESDESTTTSSGPTDSQTPLSTEPTTTTSSTAPEPQIGPDTPLSRDGVGPIKAGMTVYEAERAAGMEIIVHEPLDVTSTCGSASVRGVEPLFLYLRRQGTATEDPKAATVEVFDGTSTVEGVGEDDPVSAISETYGAPTRTLDYPYETNGQVLVYESGGYAYAFFTDGARVVFVQSGLTGSLPKYEGCA